MPPQVDFYFDVGSPAAYLAFTQIEAIAREAGASVNHKPMLLGGVFQATGNASPATVPAKGAYTFTDFDRFARRYGVPLKRNPHFPINTLALMRSDAVIINTARSGLIDEKALCAALEARRIAGAALDVLDAEQGLSLNVKFGEKCIAEIPNLLVNPHIAGQTTQSLRNVGTCAWNDIQAVLAGETPKYPFNKPASQA